MQQIGLISDTHGYLNPAAVQALRGSDLILHAGDIGGWGVLQTLEAIAPVIAVRGNMDRRPWAQSLPKTQVVEVEEALLFMLHDAHTLDLEPRTAGFAAVISGHSHRPHLQDKRGVLYVNPGSAGCPPAGLEPSLALLLIDGCRLQVAFHDLVP